MWDARCRLYCYTSQPGPGAAPEKFNEIKSPIWTFILKSQVFSPVICLGFRAWDTPGSGGHTCVKNLP